MRNLLQARLEFFIAIGLLLATGTMGAFLTYPQYQQYQFFKTATPQDLILRAPTLRGLPIVANLAPDAFDRVATQSIAQLAKSSQVQIVQITSALSHPSTIANLPSQVVDIPVQIEVKGTFPTLQTFLDNFMVQCPQCDIQSIQFSAQNETAQPSDILAKIHLNMMVNSKNR